VSCAEGCCVAELTPSQLLLNVPVAGVLSLLDNELEMCTCETPLQHVRERIERIVIKGEKK
jgi:hypothetical protein